MTMRWPWFARSAGRSDPLLARLAPRPIDPEGFDEASVDLRDEDGSSVGPAKSEVRRHLSAQGNFAHQISVRREHRDGAVGRPRHEDLAVDVGPQAVELERAELLDQPRRDQLCVLDPIGPKLVGRGLADIKRRAVRAHVDAVRRTHSAFARHDLAAPLPGRPARDAPDLPGSLSEAGIARVERTACPDRKVVGLVEPVGMKIDARRRAPGFEQEYKNMLCFLKSATYIRPSRSNRIPLPMLPAGSAAKSCDCVAPRTSLPIVPCRPKFTTKRVPAASTAGPSIPAVYSPAGVSRRLSNRASSAVAWVAPMARPPSTARFASPRVTRAHDRCARMTTPLCRARPARGPHNRPRVTIKMLRVSAPRPLPISLQPER